MKTYFIPPPMDHIWEMLVKKYNVPEIQYHNRNNITGIVTLPPRWTIEKTPKDQEYEEDLTKYNWTIFDQGGKEVGLIYLDGKYGRTWINELEI